MYKATTGGGVDKRPVVELDVEFMDLQLSVHV